MTSGTSMAEMLGQSAAMAVIREQVAHLLRRQAEASRLPPILIEGETGTGKGLLARAIHRYSRRAAAPFIDINCAAIPEHLVEAELFGFERGAFTDARHAKPGLFQAAHRGVLFLDEIGLLSAVLQGKVLKVIEDRAVRRLGSVHAEPTDVWIMAATSEDLLASTRRQRFREDLYHRLAALTLRLPALRERGEDVLLLAEHFLARACADYGSPAKTLDEDARQALLRYPWPGNVRELSNAMERAVLLSDERHVTAGALGLPDDTPTVQPGAALGHDRPEDRSRLRDAMGDMERRRIVQILAETGGNMSRAAARLGIPRSSLRYRLEKHGLYPASPAPAAAAAAGRPIQADPDETWNGSGVRPVDWRERQLAFLQVRLSLDAEGEVGSRAQRLVQMALRKVESLGGRLDEQGAAGFVAVFGLEPVEDACTRAAHAALAVQTAVRRGRAADLPTPPVVCALHAGHLLTGLAGSKVVIDMDARHRAQAVLQALSTGAADGRVLVSEAAAPLLERRFQLEPVRGGTTGEGSSVYRIAAREPTGYGLAGRPLSPFVGRGSEMALLDGVRARVTAGHGQVVALLGEPGIGKSRITYELARAARQEGWMALEGHAASHGAATPYLALGDLLRRYFGLEDDDAPEAVAERVRGRLAALGDPALAGTLPGLLAVVGDPTGDDAWQRLDPPERRERILDAVRRLLLRESHAQPLLVLFEDLHWIDAETQAFLDRLVDSLPTARVLLVVSYRPEYRHGWGSKTYYRQLQVDPLSPETAEALLNALLGNDAGLGAIKRLMIEWTEGNPFFIEETVCSLAETGVLDGPRGAYRVTRVVHDLQVPVTAEAMLAARIDRLAPEDKHVLQVASVVGRKVPVALLAAVVDVPGDVLLGRLVRLRSAEFLYQTGLPPDVEYCFKHALTHEVAYAGLPADRRREQHARIVDAMEVIHADRLGEHVERLAHHALRGELREKAVDYLRRAGGKAAARSAPQEARASFEQALAALDVLPDSRSNLEQAFDIRLDLRAVMQQLGEGRLMLERLREAEAIAERLNDDHRRGQVCALATNDHSRLEELDEALVTGARALDIACRLGDTRLRVLTTSFLAQAHYYRGEYERAVELAGDNVATLPVDRVHEFFGNSAPASVYDRACLVRSLAELGRFAEAARYEAEAIDLAESTRHTFTIAAAHWAAGTHHISKGDWAQARSLIEHEIEVVRAGSLVFLLPFAVAASAWVLAQLGEASDARERLREGADLLEPIAASGRVAHRTWVYHALGRASVLLGRLDEARGLAERAVEAAQVQHGFAAHALHLLGEIATHPGRFDADAGEVYYRRALARAEGSRMRPLIAHCHLGLGRLYGRVGHQDRAGECLGIATAMYREMGMTYWREKIQADHE